MNDYEYKLTFYEWANYQKNAKIKFTIYGFPDTTRSLKQMQNASKKYYQEWLAKRKDYVARKKQRKIFGALGSLKSEGIECELMNFENGCIKAKSKHGINYIYYATTGTIAGYKDTFTAGLDELIKLCKEG